MLKTRERRGHRLFGDYLKIHPFLGLQISLNIDDENVDGVGGGDVNDETNCGCREEIFV